jgi:hypothetical protein
LPLSLNQLQNKKNALLIGINYTNTSNQLNGCINDTIDVNNLLQQHNFNSIKIINDNTEIKPTKNNILNELKNLLTNAISGDILFFQYSGHGFYTKDTNNDEINTNYDEAIVPLDFNLITDDELKNIINTNLKTGITLVALFDSCFSGSILDLKYQYMDSLNDNNLTINDKVNVTNGNVILISGCNDKQTNADAYIGNNKYNGALTYCFYALVKKYSDQNKQLTWRNLILEMRSLLLDNGFDQIPQLSSGQIINLDVNIFFLNNF